MPYYIFNTIPRTHPSWTLAVNAINETDARNYIQAWHGSGKLVQVVKSGTVNAACGATTEKARALIREKDRLPIDFY